MTIMAKNRKTDKRQEDKNKYNKQKKKTKNNLITDNSHNNNTKARHLEFFFFFNFLPGWHCFATTALGKLLWSFADKHSTSNRQRC